MGLGGIEIDGVALFQDDGLATNIKFHLTLEHEVEFLSLMGILINGVCLGLRLYGYDKHIGLVVDETTYQTLILIGLGALHTHTLTLANHEVRLHVRGLCKHQLFSTYTILVGYLHQIGDGDVEFASFNFLILLRRDANGLCHLAYWNVEHVAQSTQTFANLL